MLKIIFQKHTGTGMQVLPNAWHEAVEEQPPKMFFFVLGTFALYSSKTKSA